MLQQLLAAQPGGGSVAAFGGAPGYEAALPLPATPGRKACRACRARRGHREPAPVGSIITTPELMTVLSAAQNASRAEAIDIDHVPVAIDLRQFVLTRASDANGAPVGSMGRTDEDTVNLVGMLFNYILNDRNLAIPMKAMIGRLQIPMLKVAILDKSFFSSTSHPARQLLNELSGAGIGWSSAAELKRDALYDKIESVVLRVLNNFSDDPAMFGALVEELRKFVQVDRHRVQIVEQRVKEVEAGRAKTIGAKHTVERLMNQKASGLRLPPEIGRFISDTWSRVLVYLCVRHGDEGSEWSDAMQTFDDLLWSVQPLDALADIEERDRARPGLLERIERGMEVLNLAGSDVEATIAMLKARLSDIADSDRAFLEDDRPHTEAPEQPLMEEIVLTGPGEAEPIETAEPEPEMVREINRLTEGVWVEMVHNDDQKIALQGRGDRAAGQQVHLRQSTRSEGRRTNAHGACGRIEAQVDRDPRRITGLRARAGSRDRQPAPAAPQADLKRRPSHRAAPLSAQREIPIRVVEDSLHGRHDDLGLRIDLEIDADRRPRHAPASCGRSFRESG